MLKRHPVIKILIFIFFFICEPSFAKKLILTSQEWDPYLTIKDGKLSGIAINIVVCILDKMKIDYDIHIYPWARAQDEVRKGNADAFFVSSINNKRNEYAVPTEKLLDHKWFWVMNKNSNLDPNTNSFRNNAVVGVKFGTGPEIYLETHKYKVTSHIKQSAQLIGMLKLGRIEAFLIPELSLLKDLKKQGYNTKDFKIIFHSNRPLVLYFSKKYIKKNANILANFNSYIDVCQGSE